MAHIEVHGGLAKGGGVSVEANAPVSDLRDYLDGLADLLCLGKLRQQAPPAAEQADDRVHRSGHGHGGIAVLVVEPGVHRAGDDPDHRDAAGKSQKGVPYVTP